MYPPKGVFVVRTVRTGAILYCGRCLKSARYYAANYPDEARIWFADGHSEIG